MELGARIKQARLERGLSQRQLCGDEITRNMLSLIENGSARPSMTTLSYLAQQLGKPISYFLEEQAPLSPNQQVMTQARQLCADGEYRQTLEVLEGYQSPDEVFDAERWLLEDMSLMGLAEQVICEGKYVYAQTLLQRAEQAESHCTYFPPALRRERILLMYRADPGRAAELVSCLPADDRELLLRAQAFLAKGEFARSARVLDAAGSRDPQWHYLRGQAAMGEKDYALAAEHYRMAEELYPRGCAEALEQCYRELEDYKMAYFYACKQRDI